MTSEVPAPDRAAPPRTAHHGRSTEQKVYIPNLATGERLKDTGVSPAPQGHAP
jgi:hypothetical protein